MIVLLALAAVAAYFGLFLLLGRLGGRSAQAVASALVLGLFVVAMLGLRFLVTGINADFGEGYALGFLTVPILAYIATRGGHAKLF